MTSILQHLSSTFVRTIALGALALSITPAYAQEGAKQDDNAKPTTHGINVANMDKSQKPGDNWYLYCNGDWIKNTPMPADRARLSVFSALDDIANKNTAAIIEEIAKCQRGGRLREAQDRRPLQLLHGRGRHRGQRSRRRSSRT